MMSDEDIAEYHNIGKKPGLKKSNNKDVKVIEKIIDEEERKKDEEMDSKIHSYNPNKGYWKN